MVEKFSPRDLIPKIPRVINDVATGIHHQALLLYNIVKGHKKK